MDPTEEQIERALDWLKKTRNGYRKAAKKWGPGMSSADLDRFAELLRSRVRGPARSRAHTRGGAEDGEGEPTLADSLQEDLDVAQLVLNQIKDKLEASEEVPGRTIAAMGTLIKTIGGLKERIAQLRAMQPTGPQTEEEALAMLRVGMEDWEDSALECAMDVYQERHHCRITVDGEWGHHAARKDGRWDLVREAS